MPIRAAPHSSQRVGICASRSDVGECRSVHRPRRCHVRKPLDRIDNPESDRHAHGVTNGGELLGSFGTLSDRLVAVAFEP